MKKLFIITVFLLMAIIKETNGQTSGVPDTLAYLQTIVKNKANYIGKPFSVLMNSLKIKIKFFSPSAGISYDIRKETSTSFAFYYAQSVDDDYLSYPRLEVYWKPYLNAKQSDVLWVKNNYGGWNSTVAAYYAKGIIANIDILE